MGASATTSVGKSSGAMTGVLGKMMKPLTGIARGFGGLMTLAMGPFGIAIELIILLLPILIPLFKKLEEKTGIFSKTLEGVQNALGWVWDKIKFVFDWVKDNWPLLLTIITGPIGLAVSQIIKHWDDIKAAVDTAVQFIKDLLSGMWDKITEGWDKIVTWAGGLWESIKEKFTALIDKAKELLLTIWNGIKTGWNKLVEWSDIIENWVGDKVQGLVDAAKKVLLKIWNGITEAWTTLKEWAGGLWEDIKGKFNKFIEDAQLVLGTLWTIIETKWGDFKTWVGGLWGDIKTKVDNFVEDFSGALSGIWDGLKSGFWSAYVWVAKQVNDKLIGGINNILGFVGAPEIGFRLSEEKPAGMAEGGPVRGRGGPKSDLIPRMLSNGEYVMPTKAAQSIGQPTLDYMRKYGEIPPIGGLFGSIWNKMKDVAGALANGAEYAIKWVLGNLTEALPENVVGDLIRGIVTWASDKFTAFFKKKDEEMAVASGTSAGAYNGPPGGWTYPLSRRFSAYTFPGHSPSWAVDIGASGGTPVRAASAGKIVLVQDLGSTSYGKYMILSHAGGVTTLYAHLSKFLAGAGAVVKTGQTIGLSGNTGGVRGASGGYHLHFELRPSSSTIAAMAARGVPLARGGVVAPTRGGTLATLAEAGRSERVTPLDREGFTPAERRDDRADGAAAEQRWWGRHLPDPPVRTDRRGEPGRHGLASGGMEPATRSTCGMSIYEMIDYDAMLARAGIPYGEITNPDGSITDREWFCGSNQTENITYDEAGITYDDVVNYNGRSQHGPGGLCLTDDVNVNGLLLNPRDKNGTMWLCTGIEGWWTLPPWRSPTSPSPYWDGSMLTTGRYLSRTVTISGCFIPPGPEWVWYNRDAILRCSGIVRGIGLLAMCGNKSPTNDETIMVTTLNDEGQEVYTFYPNDFYDPPKMAIIQTADVPLVDTIRAERVHPVLAVLPVLLPHQDVGQGAPPGHPDPGRDRSDRPCVQVVQPDRVPRTGLRRPGERGHQLHRAHPDRDRERSAAQLRRRQVLQPRLPDPGRERDLLLRR